jgi:hypothetical protein
MHKNAMKCNETLSKWCKNKHGASKIIDTFETYQGADIAATSGDGVAKTPPSAGPRRIRVEEALTAARFSAPRGGGPTRRGPPAPGAPTSGTFGLFLLPKGHPRHFFPGLEDTVSAEEEDGSMA